MTDLDFDENLFAFDLDQAWDQNNTFNNTIVKLNDDNRKLYDNLSLTNVRGFRDNLFEKSKNRPPNDILNIKYQSVNQYFQERSEEFLKQQFGIQEFTNDTYTMIHYEATCKKAQVKAGLVFFKKAYTVAKSQANEIYYSKAINYLEYQLFNVEEIIAACDDKIMCIFYEGI